MNKRPIYWIVPNVISKKEILNINKIINKKGVLEKEENLKVKKLNTHNLKQLNTFI